MNILNYETKIVGVTFDNDDGTNRQEILSKTHEDDLIYVEYFDYQGSPAYSVVNSDDECLGNLPAELSAEIFEKHPDSRIHAHIKKILGGHDGLNYGCLIEVFLYDDNDSQPSTSYDDNALSQKADSKKLNRICGIILIVAGIILLLMSLLLLIVNLVMGIAGIVVAILAILYGRKCRKCR